MKGNDQRQMYVRAEIEISLIEASDIVTASSGADSPYSPDEDLGMWG